MLRGDITGFILAGGRSRRMGRDKAQLPWGDQTFLSHAINRMEQVCNAVFVVGETLGATVPILKDAFAGDGPLAGLHTALVQSKTDWNLVLPVDMPLISPALLRFIGFQTDPSSLAVVPRVRIVEQRSGPSSVESPTLQPLCAAYHRGLLPYVKRALSNRELSVRRLLEELSQGIMSGPANAVQVINEQELISAGFFPEMLMNVNTPADLERAKALAGRFNVE